MATFSTSQEWLRQCTLLVEARPQTTKITSRYSVKPKPARRVKRAAAAGSEEAPSAGAAKQTAAAPAAHTSQNPRAKLVLKAVDPASGVCLRYETTKAAEVSRLVQLLGQLSRRQAGLAAAQETAEDVAMTEAEPTAASTPTPAGQTPTQAPAPAPQQQQTGGGGKGKKKKGKR
ncbi:hypothetical protein CMQ_4673 [Grosmannia clavigera kw1407]|uniref:SRP9 domain-containing protein n=1 Tax=Grosmannia clavigera (strain kw1407 / UAMH 11150) TaxID=655863 RepID=F0XUQ7_GROCL|nr:uncharacterized protein CMQ_4673 [Grosmannia clavigera kw1407]EFW98821.1 hypothetical protein CMQ_4673 [Grosmannia clavigera kw1407]